MLLSHRHHPSSVRKSTRRAWVLKQPYTVHNPNIGMLANYIGTYGNKLYSSDTHDYLIQAYMYMVNRLF